MPYSAPVKPVVQLALDFLNADQALRAADEAVPAGIPWLEAGTPLIKSAGLDVVRRLRAAHPKVCLIADMKVMDAGRTEVEAAKKAGADVVMVLGAATDATIRECVETGKHLGVAIGGDLLGVAAPAERARQLEAMGVNLVSVHTPIDQQMQGINGFAILTEVVKAVRIPVACAGGLSPATAGKAVAAGAKIIICGGAITKAPDNRAAAQAMIEAVASGKAPSGDGLYQRKGLDEIRTVLNRVSTPNLSDAMHRGGALRGLTNHNPTKRLCGPAFTVQCAPGDWSKSVQAIDAAAPGDVLVIDASDQYPALWGGLASLSAVSRKLGGVVISGACRDLADIHASGLPLWSSKVCPDAGEPRGIGAFGIPVTVGGLHLSPGDWLVGDEDGLVAIPAAQVVEIANRAQDVMEREQRVAAEIKSGRTLAQIAELKKWEQA